MIQSRSLPVEHTQSSEFLVELGRTNTSSTNLTTADVAARDHATLGVIATTPGDAPESRLEAGRPSGACNFFAAAAVLGLGGLAIILVWHFCALDHDFIAALIGVAFCLAGWGLASRSFPHTTREYSTSSRSGEEKP